MVHDRFKSLFPFLIALSFVIGMSVGFFLSTNKVPNRLSQKLGQKYSQIFQLLQEDYVDTLNLKKMADKGIEDMLLELDPHTSYIPVTSVAMASSSLENNFEGIGVEYRILRDTILIMKVLPNSPAERGKMNIGDQIIKVDQKTIAGVNISQEDIFKLFRGPAGSKVNFTIHRNGKKIILPIIRNSITTYSVEASYMIDGATGFIKLARFSQTAHKEVEAALQSLKNQGMKSLIFDLRNNGGGLLDQAVEILDEFLPKGALLTYTKGKNVRYNEQYFDSRTGLFEKGKLVVLLNESSASASEIVSGALQDHDRAVIVGRRSFGKGLVQHPIQLKDGSELRLTVSRYYTPSGRSIQKPYELGKKKDYMEDYYNRLKSGEFFYADSLKVNDSLMYKTKKGRVVFGGGGIYPDVFVPSDTANFGGVLNKIYADQLLNVFAVQLYVNYKDQLSKMSFEDFEKNFQIKDKDLIILKDILKKQKINISSRSFYNASKLIKLDTKALLARTIWNETSYYKVYNSYDKTVLQAINCIQQGYDKILTKMP